MLRARLGAEEPEDTGRPEDGRTGLDPEPAAGEAGRAEEMLWLQQQVSGLREAFRRQEDHWAATHRALRAQMDALTRQNQELRAGLRASELRRLETKKALAGCLRRQSDTQPMCVEMERIHSAETVSCDGGDKTLSRKQGRSAKPPGRETPREDNPTSCEDEKKWSCGESPVPAACVIALEDPPAADHADTHPSPPEGPAGSPPTQAPRAESTCSSPDIEEPQNLPTEPESPPKTAQHQGAQRQQEEGEEVQHPDDKAVQRGASRPAYGKSPQCWTNEQCLLPPTGGRMVPVRTTQAREQASP
ncbi:T-complex protein 10A homolog 2 isoform X2 [Sus scrofa]|uniref:T-complex protein 10A homolog 2 isoform X2 n=1 Tax=Sus scrofa TaxID=9823 RepID=UPI000A2B83BA|nr:T-complex protein 10A homolog 2 isoform X2 [Sus scrofa]